MDSPLKNSNNTTLNSIDNNNNNTAYNSNSNSNSSTFSSEMISEKNGKIERKILNIQEEINKIKNSFDYLHNTNNLESSVQDPSCRPKTASVFERGSVSNRFVSTETYSFELSRISVDNW